LPGPGQKLYERKQQECKAGGVSLVEIDLLRAGPWMLLVPEDQVPASHRTTYRVCVYRAWPKGHAEVYRVPLRERLPIIRIPLRQTDPDATLDLQALIDQCYRNGGYDEDINYQTELDPPLSSEDTHWADALLRRKRRRPEAAAKKPGPRRKRPGKKT
jgi:hypothetical protein